MFFDNAGVASSSGEAQYTIDTMGQYAAEFVDVLGFRIR